MKKIKLTQGKFVLVDDQDYRVLNKYRWYPIQGGDTFYAIRNSSMIKGKKTSIRMHREIMNPPFNLEIDHIDGNGLNNQRKNLRIVNSSQNQHNSKKPKHNTSGYKGISWNKEKKKFTAQIVINGKQIYLGSFSDIKKAHEAYKLMGLRLFKEYFRET